MYHSTLGLIVIKKKEKSQHLAAQILELGGAEVGLTDRVHAPKCEFVPENRGITPKVNGGVPKNRETLPQSRNLEAEIVQLR